MPRTELEQLFDEYINECEFSSRMRPETIRGYKEVFRHFLLTMPEVKSAQAISANIVTEFFKRIQIRKRLVGNNKIKVGVKDSTIRTYWSKLNAFLKWLCSKQVIIKNPLTIIKPPDPVYSDQRDLEASDIHKIISAITLHSSSSLLLKRDLVIVALLLYCGLRRNELLSLQTRDINIEDRLLTVRAETSKSKKMRQIPINPSLMFHLTQYLNKLKKSNRPTPYLIVSSNSIAGMTKHGLKHWVERIKKLSGVEFHIHRFRHTFACNLAKQNVSAVKIQKLLGHADLRMTMTYLRSLTVEDLRDDVDKLCIADFM